MSDVPVICQVYNAAAQNAANNANTTVLFDTEVSDLWGMHSTVTNTGRITVPVGGWYDILGRVAFAANTAGQRSLSIVINGTSFPGVTSATPPIGGTAWLYLEVSARVLLAAGDYAELWANQNSGGALALQISSPAASSLTVLKVA